MPGVMNDKNSPNKLFLSAEVDLRGGV